MAAPTSSVPSTSEVDFLNLLVASTSPDLDHTTNSWESLATPMDEWLNSSPMLNDSESPLEETPLETPFLSGLQYNNDVNIFDGSPLITNDVYLPSPAGGDTLTLFPASHTMAPKMAMYTPSTPVLHDFDTGLPNGAGAPRATSSAPSSSSKDAPNGTRKNIRPEALLPVDAPVQSRNYHGPSATSRKEIPAAATRKRKRASTVADDAEGEAEVVLDKDAISAKRLQNTIAARRSRHRKLEYQRKLEVENEEALRERDEWRARAESLKRHCIAGGIGLPHDLFW